MTTRKPSPLNHLTLTNAFSRFSFGWLTPVIKKGVKIEESDLFEVADSDDSLHCYHRFSDTLLNCPSSEITSRKLFFSLLKAFGVPFYFAGVLKIFADICLLSSPLILRHLLNLFRNDDDAFEEQEAYFFSVYLFLSIFLNVVLVNHYFAMVFRVGMRARGALINAIYMKALKLRLADGGARTVSLMSIDCQRIQQTPVYAHTIWSSPFQVIVATTLLWYLLEWGGLAGFAVLLMLMPVQKFVIGKTSTLHRRSVEFTDGRIKFVSELLRCIRVIKFYAWENVFFERVTEERKKEMALIRTKSIFNAVNSSLVVVTNVISSLAAFTVFVWAGGELDASTVYSATVVFNILRFPLFMIPNIITQIVDTKVALSRISTFLRTKERECRYLEQNVDELTPTYSSSTPIAAEGQEGKDYQGESAAPIVVEIRRGNFAFPKPDPNSAFLGHGAGAKGKGPDAAANPELKTGPGPNAQLKATNSPQQLRSPPEAEPVSPSPPRAVLHNINFAVKRNEFVFIAGPVGSGKTALINALLGDMESTSPDCHAHVIGKVACVPQQPWIINKTLRDNILFGEPMDRERYRATLAACALLPDLASLPAGDLTEIGDKGINLSGGQCARVSLARAVYSQPSLLFLDDPLSAVDAHVAKHLVSHCLLGILADTTRVVCSNQLQFAVHASHIIFLSSEGCIEEQGSFAELMALENGHFRHLIETYISNKKREDKTSASLANLSALVETGEEGEKGEEEVTVEGGGVSNLGSAGIVENMVPESDLVKEEEKKDSAIAEEEKMKEEQKAEDSARKEVGEKEEEEEKAMKVKGALVRREGKAAGRVSSNVLHQYIRATGSVLIPIIVVASVVVSQAAQIFSTYWLGYWASELDDGTAKSDSYYLLIYFLLVMVFALLTFSRSMFAAVGVIRACVNLHAGLLNSVLGANISFFDVTPTGRILNRFSGDMEGVDNALLPAIMSFLQSLFVIVGSFIVIIIGVPFVLPFFIPVGLVFRYVLKYHRNASREIKRLDSIAKSPLFSHFQETLSGVQSIRAFGHVTRFFGANCALLNGSLRTRLADGMALRWLDLRLQSLGCCLLLIVSLSLVYTHTHTVVMTITGAWAGLVLSYTMLVIERFKGVCFTLIQAENGMTGVERILEYSDLPSENSRTPVGLLISPPDMWPSSGHVVFNRVSARYRPELPFVLKNVTFSIQHGERVAVVGRTGSGKSTLIGLLLRAIDPLPDSQIIVDSVDIQTILPQRLRQGLSLVPQDSVLFNASIRENLDPLHSHSDAEVWEALRVCGLTAAAKELGGLDGTLPAGSDALSAGQIQLLCLGRVLLKPSKIVILDEATSSVDIHTDHLMQQAIRDCLADRTIITIAHRLNTIMDYDKVLVLDDGELVGYDTPEVLMNAGGVFADMIDKTGPENAAKLREIATKSARAQSQGRKQEFRSSVLSLEDIQARFDAKQRQ